MSHDLDSIVPTVDVLYLLRMQRERMRDALVPSLREYTSLYGLTPARGSELAPHALVMHPGPMNRGVEMAVDPAELPGSTVLHQVTNGVAVRMAVLFELLGSGAELAVTPAIRHARDRPIRDRSSSMSRSPDATPDRLVLRGGTVLDQQGERVADVAIADGRIVEVGASVQLDDAIELDATGCMVTPGFVDLHVHLREPGREEAETIETGSRAAALGGFTAIVAMPNTDPPHDSLATVEFVRAQARRAGLCEVAPAGCITIARAGEQLAPLGELAQAGVVLFTDDGNGVQDAALMRRALEYAGPLGITLAQHCEVASLTAGAVMHEGSCCGHLGLPGWPALAEELMVHRDIELVRLTGSPVHLLHLSTARSVALVRAAKADGLPVTAEAAPHHFTLTDELLATFDAVYKVNPPLRTADDIAAIKAGLADGTIDAIATDHAPAPARGQGGAARPGAARHAGPRDRARAGDRRARHAAGRRGRGVELEAGAHRRPARTSWPPGRGRRTGQPGGVRPSGDVDRGGRRARQQEPQHALCGPHRPRQGAPHHLRRPAPS